MAPTIPPRNPRRLLRLKTATPKVPDGLDSELVDVWEHAATLYHGYEWQDAADIFYHLARIIPRDLESTLCLLNSALIFARLGDYQTASHVLDESKHLDDTSALTLFIMGHVELQLGNLDKAEECLRLAESTLNGSSQQFLHLGLDYTLRASKIAEDLRNFYDALLDTGHPLSALPADLIFEAPQRVSANVITPRSSKRSSSVDSQYPPALSVGSSSPAPLSPIDTLRSIEYADGGIMWHGLSDDPELDTNAIASQNTFRKGAQLESIVEQTPVPALKRRSAARVLGGLIRREAVPRHSDEESTSVYRAPHVEFQAREARVRGDSVHELAGFIRGLPRQNKFDARNAEAEHGHMRDLAEFLRAGPGGQSDPRSSRSVSSDKLGSAASRSSSVYSEDLRPDSFVSNTSRASWGGMPEISGLRSSARYRSGLDSVITQKSPGSEPRPSMSSRASSRQSWGYVSRHRWNERDMSPISSQIRPESHDLHGLLCDSSSRHSSALASASTDGVAAALQRLSMGTPSPSAASPSGHDASTMPHSPATQTEPLLRPARTARTASLIRRPTSLFSTKDAKSSKRMTSRRTQSGSTASVKGTFTFMNHMGMSV